MEAFSLLDRFMGQGGHRRVVDEKSPAGGTISPILITLPVERSGEIALDKEIALRSPKNQLLAVMSVEKICEWDRDEVARKVLGTCDLRNLRVEEMHRWGRLNLSGRRGERGAS